MTGEAERGMLAQDSELFAFLDRIESENPRLSQAILAKEVDTLLGRAPAPTTRTARLDLVDDEPRRPSTAFAWYQPIVASLPPVLSNSRTVQAARAIEVGVFADERLTAVDRADFSPSYLHELRELVEHGRTEYEMLLLSNLRLVFHWCKGVASTIGEDWVQDAFQVGFLGLIRGIQGWDYKPGYTLSTYVSWHIRSQVQRWRMNETLLIRIPVHVWERLESNPSELSADVESSARRALTVGSIDDLDPDEPSMAWDGDIDEIARAVDRRRVTSELMSALAAREADVMQLRYGLSPLTDEPLTLDKIGIMYGVTRERIRQIESKAMTKLREKVDGRDLGALL